MTKPWAQSCRVACRIFVNLELSDDDDRRFGAFAYDILNTGLARSMHRRLEASKLLAPEYSCSPKLPPPK